MGGSPGPLAKQSKLSCSKLQAGERPCLKGCRRPSWGQFLKLMSGLHTHTRTCACTHTCTHKTHSKQKNEVAQYEFLSSRAYKSSKNATWELEIQK